jgi:hypothetical protein
MPFLIKDYAETFPDYVTLAHILLTVPLTSVPCERGFSLTKAINFCKTCKA